ncbi:M4 family metallopeptidase [Paenarthrobacter sp. PH39-S1]|uniref:M4 family metallopeptidase n=1 Tax=Paenarthrobacter sp. PH39-S1 TaxID=3046204 RepID=UPI0024B8BF3C|nr:M4 family metallopeptidase [Paenarthrobacter sp. PH39-S1]MDJ0355278.1 M4 family metallopeptidase [Paenarthrobacter sp. PH39-S1]
MLRNLCRPCCSIAPPDLLARLAIEGDATQREAAVRALATSAAIRSQRAVMGRLNRQLNLNIGQMIGFSITPDRRLTVYDNQKNGRSFLPGVRVRDWGQPPVKDQAVNQAYDGSSATYEFYRDVLQRNSLDGAGMELVSSVHYGVAFDNAFWDGGQMVYGDGSGRIFQVGGLTRALDVIAHELTHGVTELTAGLVYSKQSGALNESFSDVFGSLVKQYSLKQAAANADWLIGEGILVPQLGKALRSMSHPGTAYSGDRQPGHMDDYVDLPDDNDPRNDNGGVHINSGIPNHAFYLAATALGGSAWEKAGKIWYTALTTRLRPNTQFNEAAQATVDVAGSLFSATEQAAVRNAWQEVGVLS